jgi:hypothetical protein
MTSCDGDRRRTEGVAREYRGALGAWTGFDNDEVEPAGFADTRRRRAYTHTAHHVEGRQHAR